MEDGTVLSMEQETKKLLDAVTPFMPSERIRKTWNSDYVRWTDLNPTLDDRQQALNVLDRALKDSLRMGDNWITLYDGIQRLPIAVNCGTSGSGKTVQLLLAMQHFENNVSPQVPRGKTLYITFNGGRIPPDTIIKSVDQDCDTSEVPEIRVLLRILYSAVCRRVECPVSLRKFAATLLPMLKSLQQDLSYTVMRTCRAILELKPEENLLIAADELAKLGKEGLVGVVSKEAVSGLKALVELSTASLVDRKGNSKLGALYVCASAYTAYNPALGITVGSNRPVYYMPLPPLSVESDDWKLKNLYCGPALTLARTHLWSSQYNARVYSLVLSSLMQAKQPQIISDTKDVPLVDQDDFLSQCDEFLKACRLKDPPVDPYDLLQALFWPVPFNKGTTAFGHRFHAALLADAAGLCCILRDHTAGVDRVYMSPKAVERLARKSVTIDPVQCCFVKDVLKLVQALQELPAPPGDEECGKLFEVIMLLAYRCRAASMPEEMSIEEFLGSKCTIDKDILLRPLRGAVFELPPVAIFPRAACRGHEKFKCLPEEQKQNVIISNDEWYNWGPTPLPPPTQHSEGWSSSVDGMHKYNLLFDGLLALPTKGNGKPVLFGFQAKEARSCFSAEKLRKNRSDHLKKAVRKGCNPMKRYQLVHVLVEAHQGENPMQLKAEKAPFSIDEAIVSSIHTQKWCPMVAYSSCSARVFSKPTS